MAIYRLTRGRDGALVLHGQLKDGRKIVQQFVSKLDDPSQVQAAAERMAYDIAVVRDWRNGKVADLQYLTVTDDG